MGPRTERSVRRGAGLLGGAKVREYRSLHALRACNRRDVETLNYLRMLAVEIAGKRWAPGEGDGV